MTFKASFDRLSKIISTGVAVLFLIFIFGEYRLIDDFGTYGFYFFTTALVLIYFTAYAFSPRSYIISNKELVINRLINSVKIEKSSISSVEIINKEKMSWPFRTFGVGGLFGYYGTFYNSKIGYMTWYITRRDRPVLIKTKDNKNILLSPDEPEKFVETFNK